ncbi:NAD(P)/FAD-dependent oxidoreductase [Arsukibacterium sp.]|uniref:NAD(P)/FAD-dependent oxidoreductase n=1 Tax=Arsukibacterium sp. TaxID=1977258 RepID=UPI00299DFD22|nr:FAD-dependent oxidoreductase [Arsukibacterium sp.]MDX1677114.1 FAD-dependent oxidoreductase [Arsukibacterium sp.]
MTVAVIGAGMAGAAAANTLTMAGLPVEVFDKGRSPGGRMSSKRSGDRYLDLGAQYFTARSAPFQQQLEHWLAEGVVNCWQAKCYKFEFGQLASSEDLTPRFIGKPSMQAPVRSLLGNTPLRLNCRISRLRYQQISPATTAGGWYLFDQHNSQFGPYQAVILTLPPVQLQTLLATLFQPGESGYADIHQLLLQLQPQILLPCWAVNLQLTEPIQTRADAVFVKEGNVSWLARQNSKPGRPTAAENWLVHFSPQCSVLHLHARPSELAALAKAELEMIFEQSVSVTDVLTHRWLYAQINPALTQRKPDYHQRLKLSVAGDWLMGGRVENAYLSGVAAANEVIADV